MNIGKKEYTPSEIEPKWSFDSAQGKQDYDHKAIEKKWQDKWNKAGIYEPDIEKSRKPFYNLMMFPYPSAEGLHVGNMYAFCGSDIYGRYQRMRGNDVFEPIGLDGFGIHSENFALKIGEHPMELAKRTEANFYRQLKMIGNGYDWSHKLETYDPSYFRWTQWIFAQLFKSGLAYRGKAKVNWCPHCLTVLADEQVVKNSKLKTQNSKLEGQKPEVVEEIAVCERCGMQVERRELSQWFFKITNYAQRLLDNLDKLDWSEKVKLAQRNWIGKSEGAKMMFHCDIESDRLIEVFTTRPDTIFGVTFLVLAPEHPLVTKIINKANGLMQQEIRQYVDYSLKKTEEERLETKIEAKSRVKTEVLQGKSGVFSGFYATNPLNKKKVPIYIADYVLMSYGTGAVMGVPAHDQRDWEFAKKYKLEIVQVIEPVDGQKSDISRGAFTGDGRLVNSGQFNGLTTEDGIQSVIKYIKKHQLGTDFATWHLRDWIISRQRYWGPPIPMIYCEKCAKEEKSWFTTTATQDLVRLDWDHFGWYPVEEENLPVLLPYIKNFKPTGSGVSPLAQDKDFVNVKCPGCGAQAKRETDVSDTFLDSAWYFLKYPSQGQKAEGKSLKLPWDLEITKKWLPVDVYIGGAEHAVLHLLYSRFLTMVLCDLGLVEFEEPFAKFRVNGLLIKDGAKMSKSKGNVVNPDGYIRKFGADTLRCYLMFCGRFTVGGDFRDTGMEGMHKFLKRVWKLVVANSEYSEKSKGWTTQMDQRVGKSDESENLKIRHTELSEYMMHRTIKRVTEDIESLDYNTAIAALMEWVNFLEKKIEAKNEKSKVESQKKTIDDRLLAIDEIEVLLLLLAPFAPHMTEEIWQRIVAKGQTPKAKRQKFESIHTHLWPGYDEAKIKLEKVILVVQVNGRLRDKIEVERGVNEEEAKALALASEKVSKYIEGLKLVKIVYVKDQLLNFVVN
jgi:leucyl-tRNA synthetase